MKIVPIAIVIPINKDGHIWVQKRLSEDSLNGALEFPGGKIESNESPVQAAKRELLEETGVSVLESDLELLKIYNHNYPDLTVNLFAFILRGHLEEFAQGGWIELKGQWREELKDRIPEANWPILTDIINLQLSA